MLRCVFTVAVWTACLALLTLGTPFQAAADDGLIDLVLGFLADEDVEVRSLAFEQIRTDAPGEQATNMFAAQLSKLAPDAQAGLLRALADRGDKAASDEILALLAVTKNADVKEAAIQAIGELGDVSNLPVLIRYLQDAADTERAGAKRALVLMDDKQASSGIAVAMKTADTDTRIALIEVLTERRAGNAIDAILVEAGSEEPALRTSAIKSLSLLAKPQHIDALTELMLRFSGKDRETVEKAIAKVSLRTEKSDQRAEPLLSVMKGFDRADRLAAFSALGRVGGVAAFAEVDKAIGSDDAELHNAGVRALANWPDATVALRLLKVARTDGDAGNRRMALRALIRVAPTNDDRTDAHRLDVLRTAMAMSQNEADRDLVLDKAKTVRTVETMRFVRQYLDDSELADRASLSIIEMAHHRGLREPHKTEFDLVLDRIIAMTEDEVLIDRAQRYKKDITWVRPK